MTSPLAAARYKATLNLLGVLCIDLYRILIWATWSVHLQTYMSSTLWGHGVSVYIVELVVQQCSALGPLGDNHLEGCDVASPGVHQVLRKSTKYGLSDIHPRCDVYRTQRGGTVQLMAVAHLGFMSMR